jgi:putative CocE/NonD family hydrolase
VFGLYYSGALYGKARFIDQKVFYTKKDEFSGAWLTEVEVDECENAALVELFRLDLLKIAREFDAYRTFTGKKQTLDKDEYELEGDIYCRRKKKDAFDIMLLAGEPVAFISASRESTALLVKEGYERKTVLAQWEDSGVSPDKYNIVHAGNFMVPMSDNVKLSTDVWLPEGEGPFPVVLTRTPYGRFASSKLCFKYVRRGYALVCQDVRGREDSEGDWYPMYSEIPDGKDTLDWIVQQKWCNGKIGMIGPSYLGFVQWAAAATGHKNLKALVSMVTGGPAFKDVPRRGGMLASGVLAWSFAMTTRKVDVKQFKRDDWDEVLAHRPIGDIPKYALGYDVPFFTRWIQHEQYDDFWRHSDWYALREKISVPALIQSGWYDDDNGGSQLAWDIAKDYKKENRFMILGPWKHAGNAQRDLHAARLGNNALMYELDLYYQRWFDNKLKDMDTGFDKEKGVRFYMLGKNEWRESDCFPPSDFVQKSMYFGSETLSFEPQAVNGDIGYSFDPYNPAPHLIDMAENEIAVPGNYKDVEERPDVITFTSDLMSKEMEIAGDIVVEFFASSSAVDTDWIVRLTDVDESGNSVKLSDGQLRARFRNGFDHVQLLTPGKPEKFTIRMSNVANCFLKGHRLRLHITSGAKGLCFPNYNTGKSMAEEVEIIGAQQKVYFGEQFPSRIIINSR